MKNTTATIALLISIAFIMIGCGSQDRLNIIGKWEINPKKSMIEACRVQGMTEEQTRSKAEDKDLLDDMPRVPITITNDKVTLGESEEAGSYITLPPTQTQIAVEITDKKGRKTNITFQIYDDESFKLISSPPSFMNDFIWDKTSH